MRVLDIRPNCCWSFRGKSPVVIRQLRAAAAMPDEERRAAELKEVDGRAYRIVGDPTLLELAEDFFDEIYLEFVPDEAARTLLEQKIKRWVRAGGRIRVCERGEIAVERDKSRMAGLTLGWPKENTYYST